MIASSTLPLCPFAPPQRLLQHLAAVQRKASGLLASPQSAPHWSSQSLQHLRMNRPFFSLHGFIHHQACTMLSRLAFYKLHTQGLATLSVPLALAHPGEPLSVPNTLGIRPSKLYSFPVVDSSLSKKSLRSCALLQNFRSYSRITQNLVPTLQRLTPTEKAVLLTAPQRVRLGRSLLLSWAFQPPRSSPKTYP